MKTMMNTKEGGKEQSYILRKFKVNETSLKLMKLHHANHRRRGYILERTLASLIRTLSTEKMETGKDLLLGKIKPPPPPLLVPTSM